MSALAQPLAPRHRPLWPGVADVLPAIADLLDPAMVTCLGVLLLTLLNGLGA